MTRAAPTYPRTVFVLTANYNVRKVAIVRETHFGVGVSARGVYHRETFNTAEAAIKAGRRDIDRTQKRIKRSLDEISKHIDALNKAEELAKEGPRVRAAGAKKGGAA